MLVIRKVQISCSSNLNVKIQVFISVADLGHFCKPGLSHEILLGLLPCVMFVVYLAYKYF